MARACFRTQAGEVEPPHNDDEEKNVTNNKKLFILEISSMVFLTRNNSLKHLTGSCKSSNQNTAGVFKAEIGIGSVTIYLDEGNISLGKVIIKVSAKTGWSNMMGKKGKTE